MQSKPEGRGNEEADQQQPMMMYPDPWWKNNSFGGVLPQERPSGSESNDFRSESEDGGKDSQAATSPPGFF
ncbi:hypothetical protein F2Q69_00018720 [Brassica cretica]|uniref:Uncharacterized protein n=1 Tax=Brassica cretica TaxID=69181 RepID=A0A8S9QGL5_BRACR|nr:hypothetical protein F2Q69_00018720 [Brassica cretica]